MRHLDSCRGEIEGPVAGKIALSLLYLKYDPLGGFCNNLEFREFRPFEEEEDDDQFLRSAWDWLIACHHRSGLTIYAPYCLTRQTIKATLSFAINFKPNDSKLKISKVLNQKRMAKKA